MSLRHAFVRFCVGSFANGDKLIVCKKRNNVVACLPWLSRRGVRENSPGVSWTKNIHLNQLRQNKDQPRCASSCFISLTRTLLLYVTRCLECEEEQVLREAANIPLGTGRLLRATDVALIELYYSGR